jgi:hypothetical protein
MSKDIHNAVDAFCDAWNDDILMDSVGKALTCTEVELLADIFRAVGRDEDAQRWVDAHAEADESIDAHYRGA